MKMVFMLVLGFIIGFGFERHFGINEIQICEKDMLTLQQILKEQERACKVNIDNIKRVYRADFDNCVKMFEKMGC